MEELPGGTGRFFRTLNVLYVGMFLGNVFFFFIAYYLVHVQHYASGFDENLNQLTIYAVAISVGAIAMVATLLYQRFIAAGTKLKQLMQKRQRYQVATILYASMLNGAALFTLVVFLMVGNDWHLIFYAIVMGLYLLRRPSKEGFIRDMALTREQMQRLEDL